MAPRVNLQQARRIPQAHLAPLPVNLTVRGVILGTEAILCQEVVVEVVAADKFVTMNESPSTEAGMLKEIIESLGVTRESRKLFGATEETESRNGEAKTLPELVDAFRLKEEAIHHSTPIVNSSLTVWGSTVPDETHGTYK